MDSPACMTSLCTIKFIASCVTTKYPSLLVGLIDFPLLLFDKTLSTKGVVHWLTWSSSFLCLHKFCTRSRTGFVLFPHSTYFSRVLPFDNLQESLTSTQTSFLILSTRFLLFNVLWYMVYRVKFRIQKHRFYLGAHSFFSCGMIMRLWFYSVCSSYPLSHHISHNLFLKLTIGIKK